MLSTVIEVMMSAMYLCSICIRMLLGYYFLNNFRSCLEMRVANHVSIKFILLRASKVLHAIDLSLGHGHVRVVY